MIFKLQQQKYMVTFLTNVIMFLVKCVPCVFGALKTMNKE